MKKIEPKPILSQGIYTIIEKDGKYGLAQYNTTIIIDCIFPAMKWLGEYLCIFNGSKWACVRRSTLSDFSDTILRRTGH